MTDTPLSPREADDALAAEYVLGVLDLADRAAAEARQKRDPAFAAMVADWESRLQGLNDGFDEAPAPDLLPQIEARLFPVAQRPRRQAWRAWFAAAGLAATVAIAALFVVPQPPAPEVVATLAAEAQPLQFSASYAEGELRLARTAGPEAAVGRVYELWLIVGEAAPVSLGLVETASLTTPVAEMPEGAVLAISLEPAGGSTTGAPTGPVLVTGVVQGA